MQKKSTLQPDKVLDTKDAICPLPVLMTNEVMQRLKTGDVLKVITRDPTAKDDIQVWATRKGNELLKIDEKENTIAIYLQKGAEKDMPKDFEDIDVATKKVKHLRLYMRDNERHTVESDVILEAPTNIMVNKISTVTIMATPIHLEDLAVGYLLDEKIIDEIEQIKHLEVKGTNIIVQTNSDVAGRIKASKNIQVITSECVSLGHYLQLSDKISIPKVVTDYIIDAKSIGRMVKEFNSKRKYEKHPGGIHSAGLFVNGQLSQYRIDVSRHSAVDKVIGAAAKYGSDFSQSVIITSGRQPAGMVLKAARMNIPLSVSIRGPIYSGILAAQNTGVTLVCYASANRMDIHSEAGRILNN